MMTREKVIDMYFMEARAKVIDVAAFLDRAQRAAGEDDFRLKGLKAALKELLTEEEGRTKRVLLSLSDPTTEPLAAAPGKGASGAWPGKA